MALDFTSSLSARSPSPDAVTAAFQKKHDTELALQQQKEERKRKAVTDILSAIEQGQTITSNMMKLADERRRQEGIAEMTSAITSGERSVTKAVPAAGPSTEGGMSPVSLERTTLGQTPEGQASIQRQLLAGASKANPKELSDAVIQQTFPSPTNSTVKGFQQTNIQVKDPQTGRMQTKMALVNTVTGGMIHPLTSQPIVSAADLLTLPDRGFAEQTSVVGYTEEGLPVVKDRTGNLFVGDSGEPYSGPVLPKKENLSTGEVNTLSAINEAKQSLTQVAKFFDPAYVGPAASKVGKLSDYVEALNDEKRTEFYGWVEAYRNQLRRAMIGTQMTETEIKNTLRSLLNENLSTTAFVASTKRALMDVNNKHKAFVAAAKTGRRVVSEPADVAEIDAELDKAFGRFAGTSKNAEQRYKELEEQGMLEKQIYEQMAGEGY